MGYYRENNEVMEHFIEEKQVFRKRSKRLDLIYIISACLLILIWAAYYFNPFHFKIKLPEINLGLSTSAGNTNGNIVNGGIAGKYKDWLYYTSFEDDRKIYKTDSSGKNRQMVGEDSAKEINIIGQWIYYINLSDGEKIYRIKYDGSERSLITPDKAGIICAAGNYIYYINDSDDGRLYRIKNDGSEKKRIDNDSVASFNLSGNYIYYAKSYNSPGIYKIKTDGRGKVKISDIFTNWVVIQDKYIYGYDINEKTLYRIKMDGSEKTKIASDYNILENETGINISSGRIYFAYGNAVKRMKLDGTSVETVGTSDSAITSINIVDNWVYYTTLGSGLGRVKTDGSLKENEKSPIPKLINSEITENNTLDSRTSSSELFLNPPADINDSCLSAFGEYKEYIYYIDWQKGNINRISISGSVDKTFSVNNSSKDAKVFGQWILYKKLPSNKVYTMTADGTKDRAFFNERVDYFSIYEGWFYYSKYDTGEFYRIRVDDNKIEKITDGKVSNVNIKDDYIYYTDDSLNFYRMNTDGSNKIKIGEKINHYLVEGNEIYYIDSLNESSLCKMKNDGSSKIIIIKPFVTAFTYFNNYIYFLRLEGSNNNLYRIKTDETDLKKLAEGFINVVSLESDWIYYCDTLSETLNKVRTDGTQGQAISRCSVDSMYTLDDWVYYTSLSDGKLYRVNKEGTEPEEVN